MDASSAQVKVVFTTGEEDLILPESRRQLLVPAGQPLPQKYPMG
jgi:ribosome biogenesis protein YTM1